jgi:hypothetical protein
VPEQGDDAAVRQIVQANSASPHFVGAAITSAQGKEPMESSPTVSRKQLAAESDSDLIITLTSSDDDDEHAEEEEYSENDCGIFGPDSSSSDNDSTKHDDDDDIDSSDHDDQEEEEAQAAEDQEEEEAQAADDQEEAQALTPNNDLIAASSEMSDMLEAEWRQLKWRQQMRQEDQQTYNKLMKQTRGLFDFTQEIFITLPQYEEDTKFEFDISPAKFCDYLYNNTVSAEQVYTVLANTHNDNLVQLQATMKERFSRLEFEPKHQPQMITYANFINNQVQKRTGSTTFWITLVPWSKLAWLWGDNLLPRLLMASPTLSTSPLRPRLPSTPPLRLRPLLSMQPLRPLLLTSLITTPPPPPLRRRPALASTLGVLCPLVALTFSTPPP